MNKLTSICVFCGSSEGNDPIFKDTGYQVGATLAQQQIQVVYGAAKIGIMGRVAQGALEHSGKVVGVIPEFLKVKEVVHTQLTKVITTSTMHQRKMKMHELSDGFITLPGGFGTMEELFEIITWAQLGLHTKPVGILNCNGFYDDLIQFLQGMKHKEFLKEENLEMLLIANTIDKLLHKMQTYTSRSVKKWLHIDEA